MSYHAALVFCAILCLAPILFAADAVPTSMPAGGDHSPIFDIPRLDKIAIDGKADDWGDGGMKVEIMAGLDGRLKAASDFDARFRLAWDDRGLLVLVTVKDDYFVEDDDLETLWQKDAVELYLADKRGGKELIQAVIAPGVDGKHEELRYKFFDHRKNDALKKVTPSLKAARTKIEGGYVLEVLLPWENIGVKPAAGVEVGFTMFVDDQDKEGRQVNAVWYPGVGIFADTMKTYALRLSDKASDPVNATARGGYVGMKATHVTVVGRDLDNKRISFQIDGKEMGSSLPRNSTSLAEVGFNGPFPPYGTEYKLLDILLDGKIIQSLPLPAIAAQRERALRGLDVAFSQYVFATAKLPEWSFENQAEANNILGPHAVKVTFFDANYEVVKSADKPGLYAAIVEFDRQGEPGIKRYHTLLRVANGADFAACKVAKGEFGKQFGLAALAKEHVALLERLDARLGPDTLGNGQTFLKELRFGGRPGKADPGRTPQQTAEFLQKSADAAITLGWLQQVQANKSTYGRTNPMNWNLKFIHELKRKTGNLTPYEYYAHLPEGIEADKTKKWPVLISLHGSGGGDNGAAAQEKSVPVRFVKAHPELGMIVIAPASREWWNLPVLDDMYAEILAKYPVDPDRVYLTGLSMGGYGSWQWVAERPDLFAAVAPICGGGSPADAVLFKDVPVWVFHGAKDPTVPVKLSYDMVEALRAIHGRVRLTIYPTAGHDSWTAAYNTLELYLWMLRQVRGKPAQAPATMPGSYPSEE